MTTKQQSRRQKRLAKLKRKRKQKREPKQAQQTVSREADYTFFSNMELSESEQEEMIGSIKDHAREAESLIDRARQALEALPKKTRRVYELWGQGEDVRTDLPVSTFYRHRKIILESLGDDIANPR